MGFKELLEKLGLKDIGTLNNLTYIIDLTDSDEYGRYYSIIDKNENVEYQEDNSSLNLMGATLVYTLDDFLITLYADYDEDEYKVVIKKLKGDR